MSKEEIIRNWRMGFNKFQIAKEYMKNHNQKVKKIGGDKINKVQALAYVEPIIFEYQMSLMKGEKIEV